MWPNMHHVASLTCLTIFLFTAKLLAVATHMGGSYEKILYRKMELQWKKIQNRDV